MSQASAGVKPPRALRIDGGSVDLKQLIQKADRGNLQHGSC